MKKLLFVLSLCLFLAPNSSASLITYVADLNGANAWPLPNASPGTGSATVAFDTVAHTLSLGVSFSGLLGTTTASHIHCCTAVPFTGNAAVATQLPTFLGFPLGVTAGSYSNTFDLTNPASFSGAFITANGGTPAGAEAALAAGMASGSAVLTIHSAIYAAGEIRGFLVPVPEPSSFLLVAPALLALLLYRRR